jgi:hypothetical protein
MSGTVYFSSDEVANGDFNDAMHSSELLDGVPLERLCSEGAQNLSQEVSLTASVTSSSEKENGP